MIQLKRLVLDVLKPHSPDVMEFARSIAAQGDDYYVRVNVVEIDDKTQTLELIIEGTDIQLEPITACINDMGGSLHSIDGVEVVNASQVKEISE